MVMARWMFFLIAALTLASCAAGSNDVAQRLQKKFVGNKVDELVVAFGPPTSSFKMDSGETAYVWQLASTMRFSEYSANTYVCKVNVIASGDGTVTRLKTDDATNGFGESLCAQKLGMQAV